MRLLILAGLSFLTSGALIFGQTGAKSASPEPSGTHSSLQFGIEIRAGLKEVVELYSQVSSRTALQHPWLPAFSISLQTPGTNRLEIVNALEKALLEQGICCIPDGEKFVMIVPRKFASNAIPHSPRPVPAETVNAAGAKFATSNSVRIIPAGTIDFPNVYLSQALEVYAALYSTNRVSFDQTSLDEAKRSGALNTLISLKTATPLTTEEACYALETLVAWNGIRIVPGATNTLKLVPLSAK